MPPCQWRYININSSSVISVTLMSQCDTYRIHSPYPFFQVHSYPSSSLVPLCLCCSQFLPYCGMYFSTTRIRWSPAQSKKTIRGQWAEQTADKVTPGEQYLFMTILQLSLGICPGIVVLVPHLECWTFLAQRVLSPSVTSPFSPAIKYS